MQKVVSISVLLFLCVSVMCTPATRMTVTNLTNYSIPVEVANGVRGQSTGSEMCVKTGAPDYGTGNVYMLLYNGENSTLNTTLDSDATLVGAVHDFWNGVSIRIKRSSKYNNIYLTVIIPKFDGNSAEMGTGNQAMGTCRVPEKLSSRYGTKWIDNVDDDDAYSFCIVPAIEITIENKTDQKLLLKNDWTDSGTITVEANTPRSKPMNMIFIVSDYDPDTGLYTATSNVLGKTYSSGAFYRTLAKEDGTALGTFVFSNIGVHHEPLSLEVIYIPVDDKNGTLANGSTAVVAGVSSLSDGGVKYAKVDFTLQNWKDVTGVYIDIPTGTVVYVGYINLKDIANKNITFIPNVSLPLPVPPAYPNPGASDIASVTCNNVSYGTQITGVPNIWDKGSKEIRAFTYDASFHWGGTKILQQGICDFSGLPGTKSVDWWKKAATLTEIKEINIPDDIAKITGLYVDKASQKLVYVGCDEPTDVGNSITFMPDVPLPLPVPPAYPGWGDIPPIKCYGLQTGYTLTGGRNRWCNGSNKLFLNKFVYYVTEDLNGNTMLIQGDCDFSGVPPSESLTWWKNAKVLVKNIKSSLRSFK